MLPLRELTNAYTGTISIDSHSIDCIFDTGSTNTWIQLPQTMKKFKATDFNCAIQFGSGKLEGTFGFADVSVGDLILEN